MAGHFEALQSSNLTTGYDGRGNGGRCFVRARSAGGARRALSRRAAHRPGEHRAAWSRRATRRRGAAVALKILYPNLRLATRSSPIGSGARRRWCGASSTRTSFASTTSSRTDGLLFLVMELHAGGDLADRLARTGPLPVPALSELARQICGALEAAHRAGVVHRDIKPQNVLVGPDAGRDRHAAVRLRPGAHRRPGGADDPQHRARHARVHGARDHQRRLRRSAQRHLQPGRDAVRGGDGAAAVPRRLAVSADAPARAETPPHAGRCAAICRRTWATRSRARWARSRWIGSRAPRISRRRSPPRTAASVAIAVPAAADRGGWSPRRPGRLPALRRAGQQARADLRRLRRARLRLRPVPKGCAVLVTGPGEVADKLDGASHAALVKLLDELPPHEASFTDLRKKAPRVPFFLADNLDETSAAELVARLGEVGFEARVESKASLGPPQVRSKVRRMGKRYFWVALGRRRASIEHDDARMVRAAARLAWRSPGPGGWRSPPARSGSRPCRIASRWSMLAGDRERTRETALDRLARWLPRMTRRSDRRLVGAHDRPAPAQRRPRRRRRRRGAGRTRRARVPGTGRARRRHATPRRSGAAALGARRRRHGVGGGGRPRSLARGRTSCAPCSSPICCASSAAPTSSVSAPSASRPWVARSRQRSSRASSRRTERDMAAEEEIAALLS